MDIQLREANAAESEWVFNVRREALGPYIGCAEGWDERREREQHAQRWRRQRVRVIVADGSDVGYASTAVYASPTDSYHQVCTSISS
jgi:hypothetical protein